jgi:hypothetical protein
MYPSYVLFQAQWDRCDQRNHKAKTNSERTSSRQRNVKLKPLYEAFLMRIQEQISENRSTVCTNMHGVC